MRALTGMGLLGLMSALLHGPAAAEPSQPIEPFRIEHRLSYKMLSGRLEMELSHDAETDVYTYEVTTLPGALGKLIISGDAVERSRFRILEDGLRPDYYRLDDGQEEPDSETVIEFDWDNGVANTQHEGVARQLEISRGTFDRLSADIVAIRRLRAGKQPGKFRIIDDDSIQIYEFEFLGEETVEVPAGKFPTVRYRRQREGSRRSVVVWFAPELAFLPVRVEHQKDGKKTFVANADKLPDPPD